MHRAYIPDTIFDTPTITLTESRELHHMKHVLRLKTKDDIFLFNGKGVQAQGIIKNIKAHAITIQIQQVQHHNDIKTAFILACAMPKKGKFELIIEKATELGIDEIYPLHTERTEVVLKGERLEKKLQRFTTVAINASKQSKRSLIPVIHPISDFQTCLKNLSQRSTVLIPSLEEKSKTLKQTCQPLSTPKAISFFIGPEGDFTPEEYIFAKKHGAIPVTLGPTILKVETAAICVCSFLIQEFLDK